CDNSGASPITREHVTVDIAPGPGTPYYSSGSFDLWPRNLVVPAHGILILSDPDDRFDTSDMNQSCTHASTVPRINVTSAGATTTYLDSAQILNTGGIDKAICPHGSNESHAWSRIGGNPVGVSVVLPPAATLRISP